MSANLRQLLLDLREEQAPTFANFIAGDSNLELLTRLQNLAVPEVVDTVYLWGPPGSGRSHLLGASAALAAQKRPCLHLRDAKAGAEIQPVPGSLLIVDDIDALDADGQAALFRAFIAAATNRNALLLAGSQPPLRLLLREDLRTRIAQGLVYEIRPLTDAHKVAALTAHAALRGMRVEPAVIQYLLHHSRRDLPALLAALDALDSVSLERHRPPTLPLLREILHTAFELEGKEAEHGPRAV